jgi:hypothetical protein
MPWRAEHLRIEVPFHRLANPKQRHPAQPGGLDGYSCRLCDVQERNADLRRDLGDEPVNVVAADDDEARACPFNAFRGGKDLGAGGRFVLALDHRVDVVLPVDAFQHQMRRGNAAKPGLGDLIETAIVIRR